MRHRALGLPGPQGRRHHRDLRGARGAPHLTAPRRRPGPPPGRFPRTARVNQLLREVIADTLERLADVDEGLRMVTVTAVEVSPDLRHAVVFLSSLGESAAEALAAERAELQRAIGRQVRLKRTPQLTFAADPGVAHGTRVEEILRHLHEHGGMGPEDEQGAIRPEDERGAVRPEDDPGDA